MSPIKNRYNKTYWRPEVPRPKQGVPKCERYLDLLFFRPVWPGLDHLHRGRLGHLKRPVRLERFGQRPYLRASNVFP